jgi:D-alanyl-D-alanine carboxypeptidase (penicillin-binding protein 5/6)
VNEHSELIRTSNRLSRRALLRAAGLAALPLPLLPPARALGRAAINPIEAPRVTAATLYVEDVSAGVVLMEQDADARRQPASTTKLATALVVITNAELDETVVVDAADVASPEESQMGLVAGDTLTVEQLLQGMLVPSGNDAARTLARYVGGKLLEGGDGEPIDRFIEEMNALVTSLGLENTRFKSPEGVDRDGQYTSARDLAKLAERALRNRTIAATVSLREVRIVSVGPEARDFPLENSNKLLPGNEEALDGVIGMKTGTTPEGGACLVAAREAPGGNRVIGVVLGSDVEYDSEGAQVEGSDRRYDDMRAILGKIEDAFSWLPPLDDKAVPGLVDELAAWEVRLRNDSALVTAKEQAPPVGYRIELMPPTDEEGAAGRVLFFAGPDLIAERGLAYR